MAPNSAWAARGSPQHATQGCGKANVYVARSEGPPERKIDVRCSWCQRRVKFQWKRQSERGRPCPVSVLDGRDRTDEELNDWMAAINGGFYRVERGMRYYEMPPTHLLSTAFCSRSLEAHENEDRD